MPSVGYGTNKKTRNTLPDGFRKFLINNVKVRCIDLAEMGPSFVLLTLNQPEVCVLHTTYCPVKCHLVAMSLSVPGNLLPL